MQWARAPANTRQARALDLVVCTTTAWPLCWPAWSLLLLAYTGFYFYTQTLTQSGLVAPRRKMTRQPPTSRASHRNDRPRRRPRRQIWWIESPAAQRRTWCRRSSGLPRRAWKRGVLPTLRPTTPTTTTVDLLALDPSNRACKDWALRRSPNATWCSRRRSLRRKTTSRPRPTSRSALQVQPDNRGSA